MSQFIKQKVIVLVLGILVFSGSLATKCVSMNNQPYMVIQTLIDLNPDGLHYYPFIISLAGVMDVVILRKIHLVE